MNALVYVNIDQKLRNARNEKRKKLVHGFSYTKNMANFEVFLSRIKLSANLLFMRSEVCNPHDITQILP